MYDTTQTNAPAAHDPLEGVDADRTIVTGAQPGKAAAEFLPVLQSAIERVKAMGGAHSLYVYGSVATGCARVGSSDVDLVSIGLDRGSAHALGEALTAHYRHLCRSVEVGAADHADYDGATDQAYGNRVFLRHYCVHLAGPDVRQGLPDFPANRAAARGFNGDIGLWAHRWHEQLGITDPALLARRIARKTLFAVAGLVSIHDATWTTDRVAAARRWAEVQPAWAGALQTLCRWGDGGSAGVPQQDIARLLDGAVADVVDEFAHSIGLWRPAGV